MVKYLAALLLASLVMVSAVAVAQPGVDDQPVINPGPRFLGPPVRVDDEANPGVDQPKPDPKAALNNVVLALRNSNAVFVATVSSVAHVAQTNSMPPSVMMNVAVKGPEMLKGDKPEALTFTYSAVRGRGFFPTADQKVIVVMAAAPAPKPPPLPVEGGRIHPMPAPAPGLNGRPGVQVQPMPVPVPAGRVFEGDSNQPIPAGGELRVLALCEATDENVAAVKKAIKDGPATQPAMTTPLMLKSSVGQAKLALIATVEKVENTGTMKNMPSIQMMNVTFKDPEVLRGNKPDSLTIAYWAVKGDGFFPKADQKVVAVVGEVAASEGDANGRTRVTMQWRVVLMAPATDENIAAAKEGAAPPTKGVGMPVPPDRDMKGGPGGNVGGMMEVRPPNQVGVGVILVGPGGGANPPILPGRVDEEVQPQPVGKPERVRMDGGPVLAPGPAVENPNPPAAGEEKPDPKAMLERLVDAAKTSPLVLISTVEKAEATFQQPTAPPRNFYNVTLKNLTMLKGEKPEKLTFVYSAVQGREFEPKTDQKVIAVVMRPPAIGRPPGHVILQPGVVPGNNGGGVPNMPVPQTEPSELAPPDPGNVMHSPVSPTVGAQPVQEVQPAQPDPPLARPPIRVVGPLGGGPRITAMVEATDENVAAVKEVIAATSQPASQPANAGEKLGVVPRAGQWTNLFADEQWYKTQATAEQDFAGTLTAVPQTDMATTLQRSSYYRLGSRSIARKADALDALVGKKVIICGKPYDINLEGQRVSEIWPGAVRVDDSKVDSVPATPEPLRRPTGLD